MQARPYRYLKTNRGLFEYIIFSILTLGIYSIVCMSKISNEINLLARKDYNHTMHYCLVFFILSPLTAGIYELVWHSCLSSRMGNELYRRGIPYSFGAGAFWGWGVFGILLFGIGPLIYGHKLLKAMNYLAADYNERGEL